MTDRDEVIRSLTLIHGEESAAEIRILKTVRGTLSGFFTDWAAAADEVFKHSGRVPGVYFTINPVTDDLRSRADNRLHEYAKRTSSDADISCRRWILVDFDPARSAGSSSTAEEHQNALDRAIQCRDFLANEGFPSPIFADSGNGAHLLYRTELNNDALSTQRVRDFLQGLAVRFSDELVDIDRSVFNAARICKVYGTIAAKGDSSVERPHRLSRIIAIPDAVQLVTASQLGAQAVSTQVGSRHQSTDFDPGKWLASHGIDVLKQGPWGSGGFRWTFRCPWNSEHNTSCAFVVRLAGGALAAGCLHSSCRHQNWESLRNMLDPLKTSKREQKRRSQKTELIACTEDMEVFSSREGEAYASFESNGHRETWSIGSKRFEQILAGRFFKRVGDVPPAQTLKDACRVLQCQAQEGAERDVALRVAEEAGKIYIDVGNAEWNAIEIDEGGYRIVPKPPVRFRRSSAMQPLPIPEQGGDIKDLFRLINVPDSDGQVMVAAWLIAALRPSGPHPILALHGEQGSAKSTTSRVLRRLVDPNGCPLRGEPKDQRDLMIAAQSNWVLSFDNFSFIPDWLSDSFCRLATGGGFATRELYTNMDEVIISAQRPIIINGIDELATRSDLLDRCLVIHLPTIGTDQRQTEQELWAEAERLEARLFGKLLEAVATALRNRGSVKLSELPRLADFLLWATSAESALGWTDGTVCAAYNRNTNDSNEIALGASPLAGPMFSLMSRRSEWVGTATQLLDELVSHSNNEHFQRSWPRTATILSNRLRRLATNLRKAGLEIEFFQSSDAARTRLVRLTAMKPLDAMRGPQVPF